jgi:mono/diheme cytochrome c family protein
MSLNRIIVNAVAHRRALPLALAMLVVAFAAAPARAQGQTDNPWVAPERAAHRANPVPATTDAAKRGRDLFHRECEQCHGKAGHGDGMKAASLIPRPADLASQRIQAQPDGSLFWKMSEGRGMMPKAPLSDTEKWTVIDYLRTLPAAR